LPFVVAALKHLICPPGGDDLGIGTVFADQQIGGSPDVAVGDHIIPLGSVLIPTVAALS
jgi:hypothetical protein